MSNLELSSGDLLDQLREQERSRWRQLIGKYITGELHSPNQGGYDADDEETERKNTL